MRNARGTTRLLPAIISRLAAAAPFCCGTGWNADWSDILRGPSIRSAVLGLRWASQQIWLRGTVVAREMLVTGAIGRLRDDGYRFRLLPPPRNRQNWDRRAQAMNSKLLNAC